MVQDCLPDTYNNGHCDPGCNNPQCNYDGGDCNQLCNFTDNGCNYISLGDGICNPECRNDACAFDYCDCFILERLLYLAMPCCFS